MAASYAAVRRKASTARRRRRASVVFPSLASRSAIRSAYWPASVTTATAAWFFAPDRIIDGPPISICSMASASVTPALATVASKG